MRIYIPYWDWEDYKNGMWRKIPKEQFEPMLSRAIEFTGDHIKYGNAMGEVLTAWNKTMLNTLTNQSVNKRAFLGHCACSYAFNCPEYVTRAAWKQLTEQQRFLADDIAQKHINKWTDEYKTNSTGLRKDMGKQMLLKWDS